MTRLSTPPSRNGQLHVTMWPVTSLPSPLLHAVGERKRRIALVLGAGCSLEHQTNLKLASVYSQEAHDKLMRDGDLCSTHRRWTPNTIGVDPMSL